MIKARVIQRISGLTCVKLHEPRLAVTGSMRLAEKSYHNSEGIAAGIDDRHAKNRPEANLSGCINKRKICSEFFNVFNQYTALRREKRSRQLAERLDLLFGESGEGRHLERFAGALRQQQEHGQVGFLQRGNRS